LRADVPTAAIASVVGAIVAEHRGDREGLAPIPRTEIEHPIS
jgi:hypothetical protein